MIEKLKTINPYDETEIDMDTNSVAGLVYENTPLVQKINELCDAVNELQKDYDNVCIWVGEQKLNYNPDTTKGLSTLVEKPEKCETPVDQYEKERKWIGCVCRFWNFKDGAVDIGILKAIDNLKPTIPYINDIDCSYAFCEPVKPDDDIIFKGDDNE